MNVSVVRKIRSKAEDLFRDRKLLIKILTIIVILIAALLLRIHDSGKADISVEAADDLISEKEIYVDIGGAVAKPGVYKATTETRLYEVIEMAGGLRSDADTDSINQAAYVEDGQKIMIPVHYQEDNLEDADNDPEETAETSGTASASTVNSSGLVNINIASKDELMTLNGIGEVMADRIIEYRNGNRFKTITDIKNVKGIGDATYEKIKDHITV